MNEPALAQTAVLRDELAANDQRALTDKPLRFSYLKQMARSAAHCLHAMRNEYEPTLAMKLGSAAHSLLLGGQRLAVYPGKTRRGKEWDAFVADNTDALIVSSREMRTAQNIDAAVRADPVASRVLFQPGMVYEQTIHWNWKGRSFRSTPDARGMSHLVDLKTTRDASLERFKWDAIKSAYHAQLYSYAKAMEEVNGFAPTRVYIVAVESKPPHLCSVHELTPRALEHGGRLMNEWLDALLACETSGVWPGYASSAVELDVPLDMEADLDWGDDDNNEQDEE
jgi:hypothetical protein